MVEIDMQKNNKTIYLQEQAQELIDTQVDYGGEENTSYDVSFTHSDWTMTLDFDLEADRLIFNTVLGPNKWLAIGLANNLIDSDVI